MATNKHKDVTRGGAETAEAPPRLFQNRNRVPKNEFFSSKNSKISSFWGLHHHPPEIKGSAPKPPPVMFTQAKQNPGYAPD